MTDTDVLMEGFSGGMDHPTLKAVMLEIAGAREQRVKEGVVALNDRDMNQAMGAVNALDDLKEKIEFQVSQVQLRIQEASQKGG